tara:strand:- start:15712 stop:16218 length:507 start_codon:yes stop_codon:yes gene_type:complete
MATIINGTGMVIKVDNANLTYNTVTTEDPPNATIATPSSLGTLTAIAAATSCTVSITVDTLEVTDKESNDRKEFIGLATSWTMDAEVFYNEGGSDKNMGTLFDMAYGDSTASQNGVTQYPTPIYVQFDGGDDEYGGYGYISSISATGGTEDAGTYSISIQGTGVLDKS